MLLETLIADGISIPSDLDVKSLSKDLTIPIYNGIAYRRGSNRSIHVEAC